MEALAAFAGKLARRYRPGGTLAVEQGWGSRYGVRAWELDNEPEMYRTHWKGQVADYAEFVTLAAAQIKVVDPNPVKVTWAEIGLSEPVRIRASGNLDEICRVLGTHDVRKEGWRVNRFCGSLVRPPTCQMRKLVLRKSHPRGCLPLLTQEETAEGCRGSGYLGRLRTLLRSWAAICWGDRARQILRVPSMLPEMRALPCSANPRHRTQAVCSVRMTASWSSSGCQSRIVWSVLPLASVPSGEKASVATPPDWPERRRSGCRQNALSSRSGSHRSPRSDRRSASSVPVGRGFRTCQPQAGSR